MRRGKALAAGIACGAICAACVLFYLQDVSGQAEADRAEALSRYGGEQVEVCVAKRDVAAGETLDASAVEMRLWIADLLPEEVVRESSEVVGKRVSSSILKGEALSLKRFGESDAAVDVPSGFVAVSVPARDVQAVGGAISPGSEVDVYATGQSSTKRIAREVLVLATSAASVGQKGSAESVSWVTLAVEPRSVQEIVTVAQTAELYFTLPSGEASLGPSAEFGGEGGDS